MQKIIDDGDLGLIVLRKFHRSRSYTIRLKQGKVSVTLPLYGSYEYALELLKSHKENLLRKMKDMPQPFPEEVNEDLLRKKAKTFLPGRLHFLASYYGFEYNSLKINKSKGRWGSCSGKKNINLSLYLMNLPPHLIDYVILHELCHTKVMNHGQDFWALMDKVTAGCAKSLRKELKALVRHSA